MAVEAIGVTPTDPYTSEILIPIRNDAYYHVSFMERDDPLLAREAQRIHAEGYHAAGFVGDEAITDDGVLHTAIDKSRGDNVEYYLSINPDNEADAGTMRKISVPEGGDHTDLPGYKLCKDSLSSLGESFLEAVGDQPGRLKEISAMAPSQRGRPLAVHEIIRSAIHDAIGKKEVWFFSIVSSTHATLVKSFGLKNLMPIGQDTAINEANVHEGIALRPSISFPDKFIGNILDDLEVAEKASNKMRLKRSFMFLSEGLSAEQLGDRCWNARQQMLKDFTIPSPQTAKEDK